MPLRMNNGKLIPITFRRVSMTKVVSVFCLVFLSFFSVFAANDLAGKLTSGEAQFHILTQPLTLQEGQIKSARISVTLPKGFHAYADQFKISNINPNNFQVGQLKLKPEVEFYDKYSKKNRKGLFESGEIELQIESPEKVKNKMEKLMFDLKYQICSDQVCYLPKTYNVVIDVNFTQMKEDVKPSMSMFSAGTIENQLAKNFYLTFLLVFLAGILTSFTPCIFPMIPITLSILGNDAHNKSRLQNILRSVFYVLGIAVTYSSLGVIAALTGAIFGQALQNKWVLSSLVGLFVLMALSMWGAFELQVPAFIRSRFGGSGKSQGYTGAFFMGMVAGIVASPCVGPVLVSILSFVSTTQNAVLGFSLLFTYAMGLGLIFIAIGASSQILKKLPRSGPWMEFIKFTLGLLMVGVALYYLRFVIPMEYWIIVLGLTLMAISIWQGAFHFQKKHPFRQGIFIVVFVASLTLTLLAVFKRDQVSPIFNNQVEDTVGETLIKWTPYSEAVLAQAKADNQPVMLDFFAEWCAACHELEEKTYTNPEFVELSKQFKLVKIDATEDTPEVKQIIEKYKVKGLPTVIFINKKGDILSELTFTQFLEWNELKPKMEKTLE